MKKIIQKLLLIASIGFLYSCSSKNAVQDDCLTSIQILDRNGFKETISTKDRLALYEKTNFSHVQPYEKVVRVYTKDQEGKTPSKINTYHENGQLWQYLEVVNGRASGSYREWHPNGKLRLDVMVMEGMADLSEEAQTNWVFDGLSRVWDEQGNILAEIHYDKGLLQGNALYYHPNGKIHRIIPYEKGRIQGELLLYDDNGQVIGKSVYQKGKKEGLLFFKGDQNIPPYSEWYVHDLLTNASYHDLSGKIVAEIKDGKGRKAFFAKGLLESLHEYQNGVPEGAVIFFDEKGEIKNSFSLKNGLKHGEEWIYYGAANPKLQLNWYEDEIHGICRSYYLDGTLESEREIYGNKKHGVSSAWYQDGSLMLIEEYENDELREGIYMKKGIPEPVSRVERGEGIVTLYDCNGHFLKRIPLEKGRPVNEH